MASYKEDERENLNETMIKASIEIERDYERGFADPTALQANPTELANIPNFILGLPVHFIPVTIPKVDENDSLLEA